jgi:general stress protein 26
VSSDSKTPQEARAKLYDLIDDIKFCMLTTQDGNILRSRPMAHKEADESGALWFFTHVSAHKNFEVEKEHQVNLAYAAPGSQNYVSLSGTATIERNQAKVRELWSDMDKVWFKNGPDDPDVVFLKVVPHEAEYWDGVGIVGQTFGYLQLKLTDSTPDLGENRKVRLVAGR